MKPQFGYLCEYCEGTVQAKQVEREAFKHKTGFVILEDVMIGVCDRCGNRYYTAETLKKVQAVAQETKEKVRAGILHQLRRVAEEQQQWGPAEQYYQQALALKVEFNARYAQAGTLHQLGRVAEEQRQWGQAREYLLRALAIFAEYKDGHNSAITLQSLARLWQASDDATLPAAMAEVLQVTVEQREESLRKMLEEKE